MKRFSLSLIISILLHLALIFLFVSFFSGIKAKKQSNKINISQISIKKIPKLNKELKQEIKKETQDTKKEPKQNVAKEHKEVKKEVSKVQNKSKQEIKKEEKKAKKEVKKLENKPKKLIKKPKKIAPKKTIKRVKKSSKKRNKKHTHKTKNSQKKHYKKRVYKKQKAKSVTQNSQSTYIHKPTFDASKILRAINQEKFYPIMAKKRHIKGIAIVKFKIFPNGSITILSISNAHPILQKAAREIVLKASLYFPKPPTPTTISAPIEFRLEYY